MTIQQSYFNFVREHCGAPDGGTAGSYRTALNELKSVFVANKPKWAPIADVWLMTDPAEIMVLYDRVKIEQGKFRKGGGVFGPYAGAGDSYYKKGWCSAALKYFAQYRAAEGYEPKFAAANIDHLVIGRNGVFAIETKNYKKPAKGQSRVDYDGKRVLWNGRRLRDEAGQALAAAKSAKRFISQQTGIDVFVKPVLCAVGWYASSTDLYGPPVLLVMEKTLGSVLPRVENGSTMDIATIQTIRNRLSRVA